MLMTALPNPLSRAVSGCRLGRKQAEALLSCSGDFLVRESCSASGQYVLSGMEGQTVKHLLLVHPNGQVCVCLCALRYYLIELG